MTNTRKLIGAAAFSVALAGGGIAGALIGVPGTSGAQESTTTTAPAPGDADAGGPFFEVHAGRGLRGPGPGLDAAATAIGITADELKTELQSGKTIAEVAAAHNVDVDTVIDAMVTEATADIREHITDFVNNGRPERGEKLDALVQALGITGEELHTALESGKTIAQVATDNGVDPQTVIDALVAAGIPQDRAEAIVNAEHPFFHLHHGPRP